MLSNTINVELLSGYGIRIVNTNTTVSFSCGQITKKCAVYPAMMKHKPEWNDNTILALSKESIEYANPFAVKQIIDGFKVVEYR